MKPLTLRQAIRSSTEAAHARVDALYGRLELQHIQGFSQFLMGHYFALRSIEKKVSLYPAWSDFPAGLAHGIKNDLEILNISPPPEPQHNLSSDLHPAGLIYVAAGSHLGTSVLKGQWKRSNDSRILKADTYITSTRMKFYWPGFLKKLENLDHKIDRAVIVGSANTAFSLFEESFYLAATELTRMAYV